MSTADLLVEAEHAHPVLAMLLAQRLWDERRRDEAVFWLEVGKLRWRAWLASKPNSYEEDQFIRLKGLIGDDVSFYGACDVPRLQQALKDVLDWDMAHRDPMPSKKAAKAEQRNGLNDLSSRLSELASDIAKTHQGDPPCGPVAALPKDDPFPNDGGAYFGTPEVLLTTYNVKRFASLKPGIATKIDVVGLLGRPESWSSEGDQSSSITYTYLLEEALPPGIQRMVSATFTFDAKKVLTKVTLPADK